MWKKYFYNVLWHQHHKTKHILFVRNDRNLQDLPLNPGSYITYNVFANFTNDYMLQWKSMFFYFVSEFYLHLSLWCNSKYFTSGSKSMMIITPWISLIVKYRRFQAWSTKYLKYFLYQWSKNESVSTNNSFFYLLCVITYFF